MTWIWNWTKGLLEKSGKKTVEWRTHYKFITLGIALGWWHHSTQEPPYYPEQSEPIPYFLLSEGRLCMKYFRIRNFEKFQDFDMDNDKPKWMKLYTDILHDYSWRQLTDSECGVFVRLMLLACTLKNRIPYDMRYIRGTIGVRKRCSLARHFSLNFLEFCEDPDLSTGIERIDKKEREEKNAGSPPLDGAASGSNAFQEFKKTVSKIGRKA